MLCDNACVPRTIDLTVRLALCLAPACSYHVLSPPSRAAPLESPRALAVGQNAIAVEGAAQGGVFDPTIVSGALRYRRGVAKKLDGVADMTAMHVLGRPRDVKTWPGAYALRVGVKYTTWNRTNS